LTRKVYAEVPPRVEYSLTLLGRSLAAPIDAIQDWAETHVAAVLTARDMYDARAAG
jgi:DNA-binding HxlR family transcriptional regulator